MKQKGRTALSDKLAKQTRIEAAKLDMSRSKFIVMAIEKFLNSQEYNQKSDHENLD